MKSFQDLQEPYCFSDILRTIDSFLQPVELE